MKPHGALEECPVRASRVVASRQRRVGLRDPYSHVVLRAKPNLYILSSTARSPKCGTPCRRYTVTLAGAPLRRTRPPTPRVPAA